MSFDHFLKYLLGLLILWVLYLIFANDSYDSYEPFDSMNLDLVQITGPDDMQKSGYIVGTGYKLCKTGSYQGPMTNLVSCPQIPLPVPQPVPQPIPQPVRPTEIPSNVSQNCRDRAMWIFNNRKTVTRAKSCVINTPYDAYRWMTCRTDEKDGSGNNYCPVFDGNDCASLKCQLFPSSTPPIAPIPAPAPVPAPAPIIPITGSFSPPDPSYWIVNGGNKFRDLNNATWNSSRGGGLFRGGPMGVCANRAEIYKVGNYMKLSAESGCSAKSSFDDPTFHFNPPKTPSDSPLEIEIWCMMQIPANKDTSWGLKNIWASIWCEGLGEWPSGGELDILEYCHEVCPGRPESNFHSLSTRESRNVPGWEKYNNNWPTQFYNNLMHIYVVWELNQLTIYAGTSNESREQMKKVAYIKNWKFNDGTDWHRGWAFVMDVKRYDAIGFQKGLNLWGSIRCRGGS